MRAISLWQPWASAVVLGAKRNETRSWSSRHRGPLVIHAAKRRNIAELRSYEAFWSGPLHALLGGSCDLAGRLPFGALNGTVELITSRPTTSFAEDVLDHTRYADGVSQDGCVRTWTERDLGDYGAGRFAWEFRNARLFAAPIPWKGSQGFFDVPDHVIAEARRQA